MTAVKTKYDDTMPERAYRISCLGATADELAAGLGVSPRTVDNWIAKKPEFSEAVKRGRNEFDSDQVVRALHKRATGFWWTEQTWERSKSGKMVETKRVKRYVPPDTGAVCFWLKNRHPDDWKDRHEQAVTGADGGPLQLVMFADMDKDKDE